MSKSPLSKHYKSSHIPEPIGVVYKDLNLKTLGNLFKRELEETPSIVHMPGFKFMPSETPEMFRLFFKHICKCGGAALLTLEISKNKTLGQIKEAVPGLIGRLKQQQRAFANLKCEDHQRMSNPKYHP